MRTSHGLKNVFYGLLCFIPSLTADSSLLLTGGRGCKWSTPGSLKKFVSTGNNAAKVMSRNRQGHKQYFPLCVAGTILAFVMVQKLPFMKKFGLILNQSICGLFPYPICHDPPCTIKMNTSPVLCYLHHHLDCKTGGDLHSTERTLLVFWKFSKNLMKVSCKEQCDLVIIIRTRLKVYSHSTSSLRLELSGFDRNANVSMLTYRRWQC